jgi:hypothetical protein
MQTVTPKVAQNPESCSSCEWEPAYEVMLQQPEMRHARELYEILIAIKPRSGVTPDQKENIRRLLMAMGDGARKPDPELVQRTTGHFVEGASLPRLTRKQKAGLAVRMQQAMGGVNDDYMPTVSTSLAFISNTFKAAGMSKQKAKRIVEGVYALIAKARQSK